MTIGTKDALTHGLLGFGPGPLLVNEPVRNQMMVLLAMAAGFVEKRQGLLLNRVQAGVIDFHDGPLAEKDPF